MAEDAGLPCRFCVANWAGVTAKSPHVIVPDPEDCGMEHRDLPQVYALAGALAAAFCEADKPSDEQIGWYLADADDVVDDFPEPPVQRREWRVERASAAGEEYGVDAHLVINGVAYVALEGGKDCRGQVVRADVYERQLAGQE